MKEDKAPKNKLKNQETLVKVLGPVEDLENYVKADWWRYIFNANYLRTDGDVVEDIEITKYEVDIFLDILKPNKDDSILDLCCGQGRHTIELAKRGYKNIAGTDRSHYLINRAKKLSEQAHLNIEFREGDARKLRFKNDRFDIIIIAGNSFGYFESANEDKRVLEEVKRVLKPDGKLLIDITDGTYMRTHYTPRTWEWIDHNYFVCRERSLSKNGERLISREVVTHVTKGVVADQFYAERLYSFEEIFNILNSVGFSNIVDNLKLSSNSKRNQDLGMMSKRILITANIKKSPTVIKKSTTKRETVLVLMGDPNKKDLIKPNSKFDDDDFYTIEELKKALSNISKYDFIYLNNHDTLFKDLLKLKDKYSFVFNLCDEGFNNDPKKELHIPALLEMFGLNYSGGTPQCLSSCYDKSLIRGIANEIEIPVAKAFIIKPDDINFIDFSLNFPVIVKPNFGDSSYGITTQNVCYDVGTFENAIIQVRDKFGYNNPILIEEFLTGKDLSVGIIGNPTISYTALPIIEEDYSSLPEDLPKICGYEAKWDPSSPYWEITSIKANLTEDIERFIIASCLKLFERLDCHDYARFDWRLDSEGNPKLLEVNPNPGWCWDGHLSKMAKIADISYSKMLEMILDSCRDRMEIIKRI